MTSSPRNLFLILSFTMVSVLFGCSSIINNTPINSSLEHSMKNTFSDEGLPTLETHLNSSNRSILEMGTIDFDVLSKKARVTVSRKSYMHFNVTRYVPIKVAIVSYDPSTGILEADVTLENPYNVDGFDVRLIIYTNDAGISLLNGDDWTNLWDIPGGLKINPFKAYAKTEPNRKFSARAEHTERIQIYFPSDLTYVSFAIDASWDTNCEEPYSIEGFSQAKLKDIQKSKAAIQVKVKDWQGDVTEVSIFCPMIMGNEITPCTKIDSTTWRGIITNKTGAQQGEYQAVVIARSNNSPYLYDMFKISITHQPKAKWTIFYYVYEENLYQFRTNLNEMEVVGSVEGVLNLVCLWDRPNTPNDRILEIKKDPSGYNDKIISPLINDYGEVIPPEGLDMHDPETLRRFLVWAIREYPADYYGMTLLSHGNGGVYGFPPNKSFFDDMGVWEFNSAARAALDEHNLDRLEFVGLESCTMSFLETAYALRGCTKVAWSSEYLMYVWSARYDQVLAYFLQHIDEMDGHDFASLFIHNALDTGGAVTYAAWDSDLTELEVIPALNAFAQKLIDYLPEYRNAIETCRINSDDWGSECTDPRITDLGYFVLNILDYTPALPDDLIVAASDLWDAIRLAVYDYGVKGTGTGCYKSATGWQILFTDQFDSPEPAFELVRQQIYLTGLAPDSLWDEFLSEYDDDN